MQYLKIRETEIKIANIEWKNDKMNGFIFHHLFGTSSASIERWADGVRISISPQSTVR